VVIELMQIMPAKAGDKVVVTDVRIPTPTPVRAA
jgi:hypothetical protein